VSSDKKIILQNKKIDMGVEIVCCLKKRSVLVLLLLVWPALGLVLTNLHCHRTKNFCFASIFAKKIALKDFVVKKF
jgi:hypothetical protein